MRFGTLPAVLAMAIIFPFSVYAEVPGCGYEEDLTTSSYNIEQVAFRASDGSESADGGDACSGCFVFGGDTVCCYRPPQPANGGGCGLVCNRTGNKTSAL